MRTPDDPRQDNTRQLIPSGSAPLTRRSPGYVSPEYHLTPSTARADDPEGDSVRHYWRALQANKWPLLAWTFAGGLVALGLTMTTSPVYRAEAALEVQALGNELLNAGGSGAAAQVPANPEYDLRTQILLARSRPVLERAIDRMGIESRLIQAESSRRSLLSYFRRGNGSEAAASDDGAPRERAFGLLSAGLTVAAQPTTRVLEIRFESPDRQLAADAANMIASGFIEVSQERRWRASQSVSDMLIMQIDDVRKRLREAEDALQAYSSKANLAVVSGGASAAEDRLRAAQVEISRAQAARVLRQSQFEIAGKAPATSLPQILDDPSLREYQAQLTALQREVAELSSTHTQEHPRMQKLNAQIKALQTSLESERSNIVARVRNEYESAQRREDLLVTDYTAQLGALGQHAASTAQYLRLKQDADTARNLYDALFHKAREAGLAAAMQASDIRVVETAVPPPSPYKPNLPINLALGLLSGLSLGGSIVFVRSRGDNTIEKPGDIAWHLQLPELGVIPSCKGTDSRLGRLIGRPARQTALLGGETPAQLELMTWEQWPSHISESFRRTVASILLARQSGVPLRALAVTSANPGEGKTSVSCNLGIAMARINRRVLLIDGDLRKPRLHKIFGIASSPGLAEMLDGDAPFVAQQTMIPNLHLIPCGATFDERILFSPKLQSLLERFKNEYEIVIVDCPPILQMADARLISSNADATILVVAQHTPKDAVGQATQFLIDDQSTLLGTILNHWKASEADLNVYRAYRQ